MESRRKRIAAIGAATALAVAGGGAAYAAATNDHRDALLNDAAQRLDVSPDKLRSALEGAFGDQLDQAVKDGRLTQQQADAIKQRIRQDGLPLGGPGAPGFGPGGPGFGPGPMGGPGGPFGVGLDAAARYLGLTSAELFRALANDRSLADVARAQGKSVDGLEQALVDAAKAGLDRAVADGRLTSDQRDRIERDLQQHVDDLVTHSGPRPGLRVHREWGGAGPGAPPPWGAAPDRP